MSFVDYEFLDLNSPSTAQGRLGTTHIVNIFLDQFETQVIQSQVKSWLTLLDTTQSTANKTKL